MKSNLNNDEVLALLNEKFGSEILAVDTPYELLTVEVNPGVVYELIEWLKNNEQLQVSYLTNIGAVHYPDNTGKELAVVYHLHSLIHNFRIRLKAFIPVEYPEIKSVVSLYAGANWMERETYDFFGVRFIGHPNLKRILNMDSMDYFPMRKEYHLEDATREDKDDRFFGR